jgi:predicted dehydrogenase
VRVGLIGLGRWGMKYFSTISRMQGVEIIRAAGRSYQRVNVENFPNTLFTEDWREVCLDSSLDGVIVATSPGSHYEIVKLLLELGLPALVEKPFTLSSKETDELFELAINRKSLCMVNYIHLFSPGFKDLKLSITRAGKIRSIFSEHLSPGPYRSNVPVLWDWGCHELAMCIDLLNTLPESIQSPRQLTNGDHSSEIIHIRMKFKPDVDFFTTFGNAAGFKRRDFCVVCEDGVFVYDGLSGGLAKQYSDQLLSLDPIRFQSHPKPLECAVNEFLIAIQSDQVSHGTLKLATSVNRILENLRPKLLF